MQKYNIHKDFRALTRINMKLSSMADINARRLISKITTLPVHITKDLKIYSQTIQGYKNYDLKVDIFDPRERDEKLPCIIFYHGGGFMLGLNEAHYRYASEYARGVSSVVVMPDYRLAPEDPFPYGVEDCYSTLLWVYENADDLGIDRDKIALVGESAGGNLSAAVSLMARDRKGPKIACQVLIYPTTDDEHKTESARNFTDTPMFYSEANKFMWKQYLSEWLGRIPPYAAPMRAESLKNLPPAFVETAEFDPLHDEGIAYAKRMKEDGVEVVIHETKGTVHGYDVIKRSDITKDSLEKRLVFLKWKLQL